MFREVLLLERKMIPHKHSNLHKEMKSAENGKYMFGYKILAFTEEILGCWKQK